jgi:hypothetical protein
MKAIKKPFLIVCSLVSSAMLLDPPMLAQSNTPPVNPGEMEAFYESVIDKRTDEILKPLALTDTAKSNAVAEIMLNQYRLMRARDVLINAQLEAGGKEPSYANRAAKLEMESKPLHDYFFERLSKLLTPEQVDSVKDKMTYNKVKVTYDAYNQIIPGLTKSDQEKIMELLTVAREKAIDGGSSSEKSAIFQVYKDQINDYLNAHGHDVAKAYKEWEARQALTKKADGSKSNVAQ